MSRPDFLPALHNMDAAGLRQTIAHASGLLAQEVTGGGAAIVLRRIADRLEMKPKRGRLRGRRAGPNTQIGVP